MPRIGVGYFRRFHPNDPRLEAAIRKTVTRVQQLPFHGFDSNSQAPRLKNRLRFNLRLASKPWA